MSDHAVDAFDQKRVPNPEAQKLNSYPLLDWLRFVLASLVVFGHEGVPLPGPIDAGLAVDVFLALSGWLIGGILLRSGRKDLPRFFFNRATRIWLPYAAAVAAIYGLAAVRDGVDLNWSKYLFYDTTFTHYTFVTFPRASFELPLGGTGNHFWSISVEEQFYLFAPLLMFIVPWGKRLGSWLIVACVLLLMGSRFSPIALGVVAALVQRHHGDWHLAPIGRWVLRIATALSLAAMWRWNVIQLHAIFSILLVLTLAVVGRRGRTGLFLGAISYPLYLNQWVGGFSVHAAEHVTGRFPTAVGQLAGYLCGICVSIVAWWLIDRRVLAGRAGWYSPAVGGALGIAAYTLLVIGVTGGLLIRAAGG